MKDMTHNNNQRRFSLKTQARKGSAALLSIALIAALTGCESLSYMGNAVQTAGGYAFPSAGLSGFGRLGGPGLPYCGSGRRRKC